MSWLHPDADAFCSRPPGWLAPPTGDQPPAITTEITTDPIIEHLIDGSNAGADIVVGSRGLGAIRRGICWARSPQQSFAHADCPVTVVHSIRPPTP